MPQECAAWGCTLKNDKLARALGVTFHRFPSDPKRRKQWELACRRADLVVNNNSRICSCHFLEADFDRTGQTTRIREGVVPSVVADLPPHLIKDSTKPQQIATSLKAADTDIPDAIAKAETSSSSVPKQTIPSEHRYAFGTPEELKQKLQLAQKQVHNLQRLLRNAKDRERRNKSVVAKLLKRLHENSLISKELKSKLERYEDIPVELFQKAEKGYSQQQTDFALNLHMYGPKAYSYLRDTMKVPLPHPRTLQRTSINFFSNLSYSSSSVGLDNTGQPSLPTCINEPWPHMTLSLVLYCSFLGALLIYTDHC